MVRLQERVKECCNCLPRRLVFTLDLDTKAGLERGGDLREDVDADRHEADETNEEDEDDESIRRRPGEGWWNWVVSGVGSAHRADADDLVLHVRIFFSSGYYNGKHLDHDQGSHGDWARERMGG
jgi:hypothetical protein